jgi:hypothetical protein
MNKDHYDHCMIWIYCKIIICILCLEAVAISPSEVSQNVPATASATTHSGPLGLPTAELKARKQTCQEIMRDVDWAFAQNRNILLCFAATYLVFVYQLFRFLDQPRCTINPESFNVSYPVHYGRYFKYLGAFCAPPLITGIIGVAVVILEAISGKNYETLEFLIKALRHPEVHAWRATVLTVSDIITHELKARAEP